MSINKNSVRLHGVDWRLDITRGMSFWHQTLAVEGHLRNSVDFGVKARLGQMALTVGGAQTHVFHSEPNYSEYVDAVLEAVRDPGSAVMLAKRYKTYGTQLLRALAACEKDLNLRTWGSFLHQYRRFTAGLMLTATLGRAGSELLSKLLKEHGIAASDIPGTIAVITYPKTHTPLFASQSDLLSIGSRVQSNTLSKREITQELHIWLARYAHIPVNFCGEPWTMASARTQLKDMLQKECAQELNSFRRSHRAKQQAAKEALAKIRNRKIHVLAQSLATGTYLNEYRKNMFSRVSLGYRPLFKKIAAAGGSKQWRDVFYLRHQETADIVAGASIDIPQLIAERQVVGFYTEHDEVVFLGRDKAQNLARHVASLHGTVPRARASDEIRGVSASRGVARGVAKIILTTKDFHKLLPGDILVTTMTSVDFIPVMERAAAFVTNEGGVTSHASIVAREMDKPCIIGTKIATQVLKDGDKVEVDAFKGMVKKV